MAKRKARFSFEIQEGRNAGLATGDFSVWVNTNKDDVYLAPSDLGDKWKLSLHGDDSWRWYTTAEDARGPDSIWPGPGDRGGWEFEPPPFEDGGRLAFAVCVCRHSLLPPDLLPPRDPKTFVIPVSDRYDEVTLAYLWMTEPGVTFGSERLIAGPFPLASGRQVWVSWKTEPMPGGEWEPQAVGSMIEPAFPGIDDVTAPGVWCKGVHVA